MSRNGRPIFVVDTNVLIDYVDIIQTSSSFTMPDEATTDLKGAHIVIPTAVIRELSSFKKEKSERGRAARTVLKRIRELFEQNVFTMKKSYELENPIVTASGDQFISILPVHANFKLPLPFNPSDDDMDGQIILATLTVMFLEQGCAIDGSAKEQEFTNLSSPNVTLLTNDNGLAIRAGQRGVKTSRFGYRYPEPYTGRRDLIVPRPMFNEFYMMRRIERTDFESWMPNERPLVANEFIVMKLSNQQDYPTEFDPANNPYFQHVGRYDRDEDAILPLRYVKDFPVSIRNEGQAIYAEALMDPNFAAIICTGPAGSGKTYMSTIYGYESCKDGGYIGVTVVPCKTQNDIGALPGELNDKMSLDIQIIKNALRNYLISEDLKIKKEIEVLKKFGTMGKPKKNHQLSDEEDEPSRKSIKSKLEDRVDMIWNNWFSCIPVENARGRDFAHEFAIYDEFQDQSVALADTLIKRIGDKGKIVIAGDLEQQRAPYLDSMNNGLVYATQMLYDDPMVARINFTENEVILHPLVMLIAKRQKSTKAPSESD